MSCRSGRRRVPLHRTPRRSAHRAAAVLLALVAAVALGGCGSNFDAQTQQPYQPAVGISSREGQVYAINTLVVTDGNGNGTVVSALLNKAAEPDTLGSVTAVDDQGSQFRVALPSAGVPLPPQQLVQLAESGAVRVNGQSLEAGHFITLTFTFANAAPVEIDVPIVDNDDPTYADVPVG